MSQNTIVLPTVGTVSGLQMTQDTNSALDTLRTNFSGNSAPTSSEAYQTWYNTSNNILYLLSGDTTTWIPLFGFNQSSYIASPIGSFLSPQGRLTLTSSTPVLSSDVVSSTSVYYVPYIGSNVPVYNGGSFVNINIALSSAVLTLSSGVQSSGKLYDIFGFLASSGAFTLGTAVAWATSSARASSAVIAQSSGIWVNSLSSTLTNGSSTYAVSSQYATYLGTMYATGNGQTTVNIKPNSANGGSGNIVGIYNAYNQVRISTMCREASSYSYSSSAWRAMNGSAKNSISYIDGLTQNNTSVSLQALAGVGSAGGGWSIGVSLNSTSSAPDFYIIQTAPTSTIGDNYEVASVRENFFPTLGFNYIQAMESAVSGVAVNFNTQVAGMSLVVDLNY